MTVTLGTRTLPVTGIVLACVLSVVGCDAFWDGVIDAGNGSPFATGTYANSGTRQRSYTPSGGSTSTTTVAMSAAVKVNSLGQTVINGTTLAVDTTFTDADTYSRTVKSITDTDTTRTIVYDVSGTSVYTAKAFTGTLTEIYTAVTSITVRYAATWTLTMTADSSTEVLTDSAMLRRAGTYGGTVTRSYSRTPAGGTTTTGSSSGDWSIAINATGKSVQSNKALSVGTSFTDPYGFTRVVTSITDTDATRTITYAVTGVDATLKMAFAGTITEVLTFADTGIQFKATANIVVVDGTTETDIDTGVLSILN